MTKKLVSRTQFATMAGVTPAAVTRACAAALLPATVGKRVDAGHPAAVAYVKKQDAANAPPSATGLDNRYEEAVTACEQADRWSARCIIEKLHVSAERANRMLHTMQANGITPTTRPTPPPPPSKAAHLRGTAAARRDKKRAAPPPPPRDEEGEIYEVPEDIAQFGNMTLYELIDRFGTDTRFLDWLAATQKIEAINEKRLKNAATKGLLISRDLVRVGVIDTFNSAHLRLMKDGAKSIAAGAASKLAAGAETAEVEAYVSDILGSFIRPVKSKVARILDNA